MHQTSFKSRSERSRWRRTGKVPGWPGKRIISTFYFQANHRSEQIFTVLLKPFYWASSWHRLSIPLASSWHSQRMALLASALDFGLGNGVPCSILRCLPRSRHFGLSFALSYINYRSLYRKFPNENKYRKKRGIIMEALFRHSSADGDHYWSH